MLLEDALRRYRSTVSVQKKGYEQERHRIATLLRWPCVAMSLTAITPIEIAAYRDSRLAALNPRTHKPLAPATVRAELNLISAVYGEAIKEWRVATANPVDGVRKPKASRGRTRRLATGEERRITRYCAELGKDELWDIVVIALETAMRMSEILGLTWAKVNLRRQIARLDDTKNGTPRDVPLSAASIEVLRRRLTSRGSRSTVFSYSTSGLKSAWRTMCQRLDIENLHFHDLRHEAISRLFELGTLDIMEIAAISGHKTLAMLKRYTHLRMEKIVRKLDSAKTVASRVVQRHFVPYPAVLRLLRGIWHVEAPDLDHVAASHRSKEEAIRLASHQLVVGLLRDLRDGRRLPEPSPLPDDVQNMILLDPLIEYCTNDAVCIP